MGYIGIITVALFFFLSGYGLKYGLRHKEKYLKGFLKRKIVPILVSLSFVNICCLLWKMMTDQKIDFIQSGLSFLGWEYLSGLWFVTAILIFYILFWFSYQICKRYGNVCLLCMTIIYIFITTYFGLHSCWTASILAFFMGVVWDDCRARFELWIRANYWWKLAITTVLFWGMFLGRLYLSLKGYNDFVLQIFLRNVVCVLFVLWILVVFQKITFKNACWEIIGAYSLEIYMTHYVLVGWFKFIADKPTIYIFVVIALAICASVIMKKLSALIFNKTFKKFSA